MHKAVEWYQKAANQGYYDAQNSLGFMYKDGLGVAKDLNMAVEWYQKAANNGSPAAQYNLGMMYARGEGVEKNIHIAKQLFNKAATQGIEPAKEALEYLDTNYVNADASKDWFDGISAYSRGDKQLAKQLLTRACNGGSKAACMDLKERFK